MTICTACADAEGYCPEHRPTQHGDRSTKGIKQVSYIPVTHQEVGTPHPDTFNRPRQELEDAFKEYQRLWGRSELGLLPRAYFAGGWDAAMYAIRSSMGEARISTQCQGREATEDSVELVEAQPSLARETNHEAGDGPVVAGGNTERHKAEASASVGARPERLGDAPNIAPPASIPGCYTCDKCSKRCWFALPHHCPSEMLDNVLADKWIKEFELSASPAEDYAPRYNVVGINRIRGLMHHLFAEQAEREREPVIVSLDACAKALADSIGHGMREKCYSHAKAVLDAVGVAYE